MALKKHRPMTAGQRFRATPKFEEITKEEANKKGVRKKRTKRFAESQKA